MKSRSTYFKICIVISLALLASQALAEQEQRIFQKSVQKPMQWYKRGELIVKFKADTSEKAIEEINLKHGASHVSRNKRIGFRKLRVAKKKNVFALAAAYSKNPNVEYARPNYICRAFFIPNDELYSYQWHLPLIGMEQAWDLETGDPSVVIAVLDTGVAYENYTQKINRRWRRRYYQAPDLAETSFVPGYDFINNDEHANDDEGHGTHVTGTIAQSTNNQIGVAGVAFNCSIMPVKVLDSTGSGSVDSLADGIIFAADGGAKVINMSLGFGADVAPVDIPAVTDAVLHAYNKGCVIVASSGNDGVDTVSLPAAYPEVIAVGAVHLADARADYSQYGPELELVAPGGDEQDRNGDGYIDGVLQQTFGNNTRDWGYWFYTGTSCAAPHVSGLAALLLSQNPALSNQDVRDLMCGTAVDLGPTGRDNEYGYGRIDALAALSGQVVANEPPVADPAGPYTEVEDTPVEFDGSSSYDPDGDTITYSWDFGDGATGAGVSPTHTYTAGGTYTITLVVNDGKVNSEPSTTTATIDEINDPPVADADGPYAGVVDVPVQFDGSGSYDIDDGIATYDWDFGDDTEGATGVTVAHAYSAVGEYTVTLTVTDNGGLTDTDSTLITVGEAQAGDVVTITKAEYRLRNGELNVEATSSEGSPDVILSVYGYDGEKNDYTVDYGPMNYDSRKDKYKLKIKSVVDPQGSVKVVSSLGGSVTKIVKYK